MDAMIENEEFGKCLGRLCGRRGMFRTFMGENDVFPTGNTKRGGKKMNGNGAHVSISSIATLAVKRIELVGDALIMAIFLIAFVAWFGCSLNGYLGSIRNVAGQEIVAPVVCVGPVADIR